LISHKKTEDEEKLNLLDSRVQLLNFALCHCEDNFGPNLKLYTKILTKQESEGEEGVNREKDMIE